MEKDYNFLLQKCMSYIPNRKEDFYEILLAVCDHTYLADESGLQKEDIVMHIIMALHNNETCIQAISKISKYDLLNDIEENTTYHLGKEMERIFDEYGIDIINRQEYKKIIEDPSTFKNGFYICMYDKNEIIAIDNTESEVFMESLDTIDEALAYLMIYTETYNYEAALITESNNYVLQEVLDEKGYFVGESEVRKQETIHPLYEELKLYDIEELGVNENQLYDLSFQEIETISQKLDLVRKSLIEISEIILKENTKQEQKIEYEKEI